MRDDSSREAVERYALVVIGAGIAGLNALAAATEYLPKGARVLLVDEKPEPGGMWNTAYDYVRLHQPHPMFTVGNMRWDWRKPPSYLAKRDEVQHHLGRALGPVSARVTLETAFGSRASRCAEVETDQGPRAQVTYHPIDAPERETTVQADHAIHAAGLNYALAAPLPLSSDQVLSIIPQELRATLTAHPEAPVYVFGGGKTGMDTVLATLAADPARQVTLIKGRGTTFLNRTKYLPSGIKRWTSGELVSRLFHDVAMRYDGEDDAALLDHIRRTHSTDPEGPTGRFLYGLQSEEEFAQVEAGLSASLAEYLEDVCDGDAGPEIRLRSGASHPVAPGSIFVNCGGSFFRDAEMSPPMPVLSPQGRVLSINPRRAFHFLTSVAGFFGAHLLYRDQLRGQGFYALDLEALFRTDRDAWVGASAAQAYLNQVTAVQTLPMLLLDRCGLDMDRWYPLPRRMAALLRMKATAKEDCAHCRDVLHRVAERFGIEAAPI
ncbi:FAD-dependent oxidoreductase [Dinoroseobacter sp. S76]|uniref:FAD-dependent oxidoreductase n=1 Tax=Dinoroseobacter sp. S76 TaxID=3415124 RepID=UPI003C7C9854